jgi:type IV pilus assembly protein PilM
LEDKESLAEKKLIELLKGKVFEEGREGAPAEYKLYEDVRRGKVSISRWARYHRRGISFPFFGKGKESLGVGLDMGSSSVKVVGIEHTGGKSRLIGFSIVDFVPEGEEIGREERIGMVEEALKGLGRGIKAAVSISGIARQITMPRMNDERLRSAIKWEASRYLPLDPERFVIDYQVLDPDIRSRTMNVLLAAVEKERIGEMESILEASGVVPSIMDLDILAMANSILSSADISISDVVAMLDIGASGTKLCVVGREAPLFTRDIPTGGMHMAQAAWKALGTKRPLSEVMGAEGARLKAFEAIKPVLDEIVVEVRRAFIYYDTQVSRSITRIFLAGGGAMIPGIDKYIFSALDIPVEVANPLKGLEIPRGDFEMDLLERVAPRLSVACGLAMRKV